MRHFIGCDAHKKSSLFVAVDEAGETKPAVRVNHDRESYRTFLRGLRPGSCIAVETVGNWYWIVDEMQQAGHQPRLAHARKAKLMMGQLDKTDKLDARGLATLLRNGTLPEVWIPSRETQLRQKKPQRGRFKFPPVLNITSLYRHPVLVPSRREGALT